jgi:hypothetical protein
MAGVTKHIYNREIIDIKKMWNEQLKHIANVLEKNYEDTDIVDTLKHYYPYEWESVEIKREYYQKKDKFIKKRYGKARYRMSSPIEILFECSMYKKLASDRYKENYNNDFSYERYLVERENLWNKRKNKIDRVTKKIEKAKSKTQQVTPIFLEKLIGLYERKNTSQKDKVYIILELQKYYSDPIIQFFFKLNDTELNKQLREIAFKYLQSFNYNPRLRRQKYMQVHTGNKKRKEYLKKIYPNEVYKIPKTPSELEYRIENAKEQKIKSYDFFISHSSKDSASVQKLIKYENSNNKNIYCDWINDNDYLKRHLLCDATLSVLESRLEQSDNLIFVESDYSKNSIWCKYELNYFLSLNKPIYTIKKQDIEEGQFLISKMEEEWFIDVNYKKMALIEGENIK